MIDLALHRVRALLDALGRPQDSLPPVVHVAGTNGKGSTIAFLNAILEASGYTVHAYTSPHLVRFNERVRLAGTIIEEDELVDVLEYCERINDGQPITYFEITTVAAFHVFAQKPADILLLECGLGGQFDATNIVDDPILTAITPISMDHMDFLGDTIAKIAFEKASIQKSGIPSIIGPQVKEAGIVIEDFASEVSAPLFRYGLEWDLEAITSLEPGRILYNSAKRRIELPSLALKGAFQSENAGMAIALTDNLQDFSISDSRIVEGLLSAKWPARLQRLHKGKLNSCLPDNWELWLDGGHNTAAAMALASTAKSWQDRPLHLVFGMLNSKDPKSFLQPLAQFVKSIHTITIPEEKNSLAAVTLSRIANNLNIESNTAVSVSSALKILAQSENHPSRVLICGSLYLAGFVMAENS